MRIVADENIPYVRDAFASLGDVVTVSGRAINPDVVKDADLLLVRSITKVGAPLLAGSKVKFVATATIGEDHIDKAYLAENSIAFSSAPGSNANSVAQYMTAALLELAAHFGLNLESLKIGIVGVGNVGRRVHACAAALGLQCVLNDPPLARASGDARFRPIEEVFDCDIVTLHVPLTKEGLDATYHLANEIFLRKLKPGTVLFNTSRGRVADGAAMLASLNEGHLRAAVLDVWENEPRVELDLLQKAFIGTPHIAGYSFDGKVNGTRQIYEAACAFLGVKPDWDPSPLLPAPECPSLTVDGTAPDTLPKAVRAVYEILRDDAAMRGILLVPEEERLRYFDQLRKEYPRRREFFNTRATVKPANAELSTRLAGIGFTVG